MADVPHTPPASDAPATGPAPAGLPPVVLESVPGASGRLVDPYPGPLHAADRFPGELPNVDLESVISTAELGRRLSRPADHAAENRALVGLAEELAVSPNTILQKLAETALDLCRAHTAGVSLLDDDGKRFHWPAIAGKLATQLVGGTPRDFGPCGTVLDRDRALLFSHPERYFDYLAPLTPAIDEVLLLPFYLEGKAVGTIWVIALDDSRRFDAEDLRVMTNLAKFASAAYQTLLSMKAADKVNDQLRQTASALRQSEERLAADLAATRQLEEISTSLTQEGSVEALYSRILDAAKAVMRSDMASLQMLDGGTSELRLLAWTGFHPESAAYWDVIRIDSESSCGAALRDGRRVAVRDVETCDFMAGSAHVVEYRRSGIRAMQSTPLVSRSGRPLGMISTHWRAPHEASDRDLRLFDVVARQASDLVERAQAEATLRQSEARFRALVDSSAEIVWTADPAGNVVEDSASWRAHTGQTADERKGSGWLDALHPEDRDRVAQAWRAAVARRAPIEIDYRLRDSSGGWRWTTARATPVLGDDGALESYVGMNIDVTNRKENERALRDSRERLAVELASSHRLYEQQTLLLREMNHRVKNLFAVVNGLLGVSARSARTAQDLATTVQERLAALARAHELILPGWTGDGEPGGTATSLDALIRAIFLPYARQEWECLVADGPGVTIGASAVTGMALVLHEFAVNSAKYGALSSPAGNVAVDWSTGNGDLALSWREQGGPVLAGPPTTEGFGSLLARRTVIGQFGGRLSHNWRPEGLTINLVVPLKRLA